MANAAISMTLKINPSGCGRFGPWRGSRSGFGCMAMTVSWPLLRTRRRREQIDHRRLLWGSLPWQATSSSVRIHESRRLNRADGPDAAIKVYQDYGAKGFALLDDEFSLVIADPGESCVYLAVDKLGRSDIFFRRFGNAIAFASDCAPLMDSDTTWDPLPVAFFIAQCGFVPGPATLCGEVESVARAGFLRISWSSSRGPDRTRTLLAPRRGLEFAVN